LKYHGGLGSSAGLFLFLTNLRQLLSQLTAHIFLLFKAERSFSLPTDISHLVAGRSAVHVISSDALLRFIPALFAKAAALVGVFMQSMWTATFFQTSQSLFRPCRPHKQQ